MIVDTMTFKEVGDSLLKEYKEYHMDRIFRLLEHKRKNYRRVILANGEKRIKFNPFSYTYQTTEMFILPFSEGKKDFKKYDISYYVFARFFYRGQYWYAKFNCTTDIVDIYSQHFFLRYIERHLKSDNMVGIDVVSKFMYDTEAVCLVKGIDSDKYENCIYGSTSIGMCFGQGFGNINVWKTYIDKETIEYGIKKKTFDIGTEMLKPVGLDKFGLKVYKGEVI